MQEKDIKELLHRYRLGIVTKEEKDFLESWYLQYHEEGEPKYTLDERLADARAVWDDLELAQKSPRKLQLWYRIAVAASIILCAYAGFYFIGQKRDNLQLTAHIRKTDPVSGTNKATLTTGSIRISLSDARNGRLLQHGNTTISKADNEKLVYNEKGGSQSPVMAYDTLTIPRAGHFQVVFADGSRAWLNAATIIRYPENFSGKSRQIELIQGEAYFEVVHNDQKPFKVITHKQVIEDIGTHFNVNAYNDEPDIKTTLLEGSVKVTKGRKNVILKPGQQSIVKVNASPIIVKKVNLDEAIAWKNDHFIFNNEGIESIMRQISRWYDMDISYEGNVSGRKFAGSVSRFKNVSEVLSKLEATGTIHFKTEGRKIIVMP